MGMNRDAIYSEYSKYHAGIILRPMVSRYGPGIAMITLKCGFEMLCHCIDHASICSLCGITRNSPEGYTTKRGQKHDSILITNTLHSRGQDRTPLSCFL